MATLNIAGTIRGTPVRPVATSFVLAYRAAAIRSMERLRSTMGTRLNLVPLLGNWLFYSEAFDNGIWGATGTPVVTADTTVAPDGTTSADTITSGASGSGETVFQNIPADTLPGRATYMSSLYIKEGTSAQIKVEFGNAGGGYHIVQIDWSGGVPTLSSITGSGAGDLIAPVASTNGYYRFGFTTFNVNPALHNRLSVYPSGTGVPGVTTIVWGAQVSRGPQFRDYRKTTSALYPQMDPATIRQWERNRALGITLAYKSAPVREAPERFLGANLGTSTGTNAVTGKIRELERIVNANLSTKFSASEVMGTPARFKGLLTFATGLPLVGTIREYSRFHGTMNTLAAGVLSLTGVMRATSARPLGPMGTRQKMRGTIEAHSRLYAPLTIHALPAVLVGEMQGFPRLFGALTFAPFVPRTTWQRQSATPPTTTWHRRTAEEPE